MLSCNQLLRIAQVGLLLEASIAVASESNSPCKSFDFFVVSQGGVGSTNFMILASGNTNALNDNDGYKHLSADHFWFGPRRLFARPALIGGRPRNQCATANRVLVIVGDQNHTLYSVTRRFNVAHINKLRLNMRKAPLPHLTLNQIRTLPKEELGIAYFQKSWSAHRESPLVRIVTTGALYNNTDMHIAWLRSAKGP